MRIKHDTFLTLLADIRARVKGGDSFEGRLSYELVGPMEWEVSCAYRIGNEGRAAGALWKRTARMSNPIPHPARYEARRSPDGSVCIWDSFAQEPVAFEERVTTMSQAIGAAGRLNRQYAMACAKEDAR